MSGHSDHLNPEGDYGYSDSTVVPERYAVQLDQAEVDKYEQQLDDAFKAEAEHRDCSCAEGINPFCKKHGAGPSKRCSECKGWFTGEHFCYGTYPA